MAVAQYEAAPLRLKIYDMATGSTTTHLADLDYSPEGIRWTPDGNSLLFDMEVRARTQIVRYDIASGSLVVVSATGTNGCAWPFGVDKNWVVFSRHTMNQPAELFVAPLSGEQAQIPKQVTFFNNDHLHNCLFGEVTEFVFPGFSHEDVQAWLIKPVGFDATKQYKVAVIVHGGPQGSIHDGWHYRWCGECSQCA